MRQPLSTLGVSNIKIAPSGKTFDRSAIGIFQVCLWCGEYKRIPSGLHLDRSPHVPEGETTVKKKKCTEAINLFYGENGAKKKGKKDERTLVTFATKRRMKNRG